MQTNRIEDNDRSSWIPQIPDYGRCIRRPTSKHTRLRFMPIEIGYLSGMVLHRGHGYQLPFAYFRVGYRFIGLVDGKL